MRYFLSQPRMEKGESVSIGVPVHLAPQVLNRAFSRAAHVAAAVFIATAFASLTALQGVWPEAVLWPAMLALGPMTIVLWLLDRHRTRRYTVAYLLVGGASVYLYLFTLLGAFNQLVGVIGLVATLPKLALLFVGAPGVGIVSAMVTGWIALVVAELAAFLAASARGIAAGPDPLMIGVAIGLGVVLALAGVARRTTRRVQPSIHRAARDEQLAALRYRIEVKAAAVMHDTVLSHLAAIAAAPDGAIRDDLREEIQRDLHTLIGEEWLADRSGGADPQARTDWHDSDLFAAIQESRRLGLDVAVSGDITSVRRLAREQSTALGQAVKQCLVNVLKHSGTTFAELVVYGSVADVSVMVIDTGRGFSESDTGADRLGIRQSVRRRIQAVDGEVQLWSTPGRGTSVMITVPAAQVGSASPIAQESSVASAETVEPADRIVEPSVETVEQVRT